MHSCEGCIALFLCEGQRLRRLEGHVCTWVLVTLCLHT